MTLILIPMTQDGAIKLISRGKLNLLKIMLYNFMNCTIRLNHTSDELRLSRSDDEIYKQDGSNNISQNQMVNSHSKSITKIEAHEAEPSPIYWSAQQQSQATPSPRLDSNFQDQMLKFMSKMDQTLNSHSQAIAKIEV
jgi:hypothetical protein